MKKSLKYLLSCVALLSIGMAWPAAAQDTAAQDRAYTPFMLSFVTPFQMPSRGFDVGGMRINLLYGECHDFDGLDISWVGRATGHGKGIQLAALANTVDGGGFGMQIAPVNYVKGQYVGLQIGVLNYAEKAKALQIGFYNGAEHIDGCQIGVINNTHTMMGVQIGLVNLIRDNDMPFIPIVNCYF